MYLFINQGSKTFNCLAERREDALEEGCDVFDVSAKRVEDLPMPEGKNLESAFLVWDAANRRFIEPLDATPSDDDIADARDAAMRQGDALAARARHAYLTVGDGQDLVYQAKLDEARRFEAPDIDRTTGPWPYLDAEATAADITREQAAGAIIARRATIDRALARIEQIRRTAKIALAAATTLDAIDAIVAGLDFAPPEPATNS